MENYLCQTQELYDHNHGVVKLIAELEVENHFVIGKILLRILVNFDFNWTGIFFVLHTL